MIYELVAMNTDNPCDIRWREYTASKNKADAFRQIPRIQFTDSGHGIEFFVTEHKGRCRRKPVVRDVVEHVRKHMAK